VPTVVDGNSVDAVVQKARKQSLPHSRTSVRTSATWQRDLSTTLDPWTFRGRKPSSCGGIGRHGLPRRIGAGHLPR
jgi:hypothetical protein